MNFKVKSTGWSWCEIQHQSFPLSENRTQKQYCEIKGRCNDTQVSGEKETFVKMKYAHSLIENFSPFLLGKNTHDQFQSPHEGSPGNIQLHPLPLCV